MSKAFEQFGNHTIAHLAPGAADGTQGGLSRVENGDTILARIPGSFGVCLLGIDTPELALPLPGSTAFVRLDGPEWAAFLTDPFAAQWPAIDLDPALKAHLQARLGPGCAANHHRHALAAARGLDAEIAADLAATGLSLADFRFSVLLEREKIDAYGRLLGWVSISETPDWHPPTYNHRMMLKGLAMPYFIWPNVAPFRYAPSLRTAIPAPGSAADLATTDEKLNRAREWFRANREAGVGVFDSEDPLRLHAFEARFLSQRRVPDRWVIDLSRSDDVLIHPQRYYTVAHPEDRLFVPDDYLELFLARGWRAGTL